MCNIHVPHTCSLVRMHWPPGAQPCHVAQRKAAALALLAHLQARAQLPGLRQGQQVLNELPRGVHCWA